MSGISSINQARPGSELAAGICYHPLSLSHGTLICSDPEPWNVLTVSLQHTLQRENWEDDQPEGEEGSRESLDLPRRSVALGSLRLFPGAPSGPASQTPWWPHQLLFSRLLRPPGPRAWGHIATGTLCLQGPPLKKGL